MKVGILGHGYVGQAVAHSHASDELVVRDPRLGQDSATMKDIANCDVIYVCLPSPSASDHSCDTTILEKTLGELAYHPESSQRLIICKTTAPPPTYRTLQKSYPNLVHVPEFLTAANHIESYQRAEFFVIGGNDPWRQRAQAVLAQKFNLAPERWLMTDVATASLYKYMINCYLATKLTFMNEFWELAQEMSVDFQELTDLTRWETRIGASHMQVPGPDGERGWGGDCFPKDMLAIIKLAKSHDVEFGLLCCVNRINHWHRDNKPQAK